MKKLKQYLNETLNDDENINAFCILKPGFLQYENEWFDMIEQNNWYIENKKEVTMTRQQAKTLYEPHKDKDFYNDLVDYMCSSKVIIITAYKDCDDPIGEMDKLKKHFRKLYGKNEMKNGMHSSDSLTNVKRESKIFF